LLSSPTHYAAVEIVAIKDPMVQGVTLYMSEFKRSLASRLQADYFAEPSQAGPHTTPHFTDQRKRLFAGRLRWVLGDKTAVTKRLRLR